MHNPDFTTEIICRLGVEYHVYNTLQIWLVALWSKDCLTHASKKNQVSKRRLPMKFPYASIHDHTKKNMSICTIHTLILTHAHLHITHTPTHTYMYRHITGTYCTRVLQETRVDESVSRELQLMQSSQVFFFLYFLQHRNSYHYDIIGIVVRSCCILNTFSVTTILFWTQIFMISYNYVVMLLVPQDPRCGPC